MKECKHLTPDPFTVDEMIKVIKQTHNWKSPGLDKLQHFWVKWFFVMPEDLTMALTDMIKSPKNIPTRLHQELPSYFQKAKRQRTQKNIAQWLASPQCVMFLQLHWQIGSVTTYSETVFPEQQKGHHRMSRGWRPAAGEKDDYVICVKTSETSVNGLDWLQESI